MTAKQWPPIESGSRVKTLAANESLRDEWAEGVRERRKWGVEGVVIGHSDSHGLCYEVRHPDQTTGWYAQFEVKAL